MDEQLRIILIIIVSVSIFGLITFVFVKNYIKNKIDFLIKKEKKIFNKKSDFVEISKFKSQDLDDPSDWIYAERLWYLNN